MRTTPVMPVASDPHWQRATADRLLEKSYLVYCATSIKEAVDFLKTGLEPAVIVMDARVWRFADGFRSAQVRDPSIRPIPVVAVDGTTGRKTSFSQAGLWVFIQIGQLETAVDRMAELTRRLRL